MPTADEVRAQLDAGVWLKPGPVAALFGVSRFVVDYWLKTGKIRYRRTVGRQRLCDPEDVRRLLEETERVHGEGPEVGR